MSSISSQMKDNFCWGCGRDNHDGLRLDTHWAEDGSTIARWTPDPIHAAGPRHVVNGGIIATLIDCHGVLTAVGDAHRRDGREVGTDPVLWYATTSITVDYLRPTPLGPELILRGHVTSVDGRRTSVACSLEADGKERATGTVETIQVPDEWRQAPA